MYEDDPQDQVFDVLGEAVFGAHPLGRAGDRHAPRSSAPSRASSCAAFHAARYRPRHVVIAAAGSVEHDALRASWRTALDRQRAQDARPRPSAARTPRRRRAAPDFARRVRFLEKDTEQYHVCIGGPGIARDDERRFALRVLEGVLGGTSSSRLFQEVRERRGLAYSVFCFSNLYAHTGEVGLYVGTRPENLDAGAGGDRRRAARAASRIPPSEEELTRSRENLKGRVVLGDGVDRPRA